MRSAWRIGVAAAVLSGAVVVAGGPVASARPEASVGAAEVAGAALVPVAPARLLDTRTGVGGAVGPVVAGAEVPLQVSGRDGVPADAVAVALTVTATEPTAPGYVTVWPTGLERPVASNLNVERAGQTIADGVVVPLGTGGQVSLFSQSATHLLVDVTAYWRAAATTDGGRFTPVTPARVLDTRTGVGAPLGSLGDDTTIELALAGRGGLPVAGIRAVALTLTATGTTGPGFATAWPGGPRPRVSALNVDTAGEDVAATVIVPVGPTGSVSLYVQTATHLVADVTGWFSAEGAAAGQAGLFVPAAPTRLLDTRLDGSGGMAPGAERVLLLSGATAPGAIAAVVGTLTATETTGPGYVAVAPTGSAGGSTSSLNVSRAGQTIANLVLAPVSTDGEVTLLHEAGGHLLLDVSGWFLADVPVAPDEGPGGTDPPGGPTTAPSTTGSTGGSSSSSSSSTTSSTSSTTSSSTTSTTRPPSSTTSSVPVPPGDLSLSPWQVKANAPTVRSEGGAATVDGRIYVMGGYIDTFTPTPRIDVYDAAADSWSRGPNLPGGVSHVAVAVIGTDIYLAGGYPVKATGTGQDFATAAVWRFDTVGRTFVRMPDLPQARGSGALVALDGELHFISGVSTSRADRTEHWVLDPRDANPSWVVRAPVPVGRSHLGYIAYQGRIWAIGGHQKWDENAVYLNRVDIYEPATDRWTAGPSLPGPRGHIGGAVELVAGRIVVMGGDDAFKEAKPNVWAYDPRDERWEDLVELPLPRYAGFGGVVGNRLYYVSGDIPRYNRTYCAIVSS